MRHFNIIATKSRLAQSLAAFSAALTLPVSAATWVGYMNVYNNNSGSQGSYIFGSGWGVPDLQTTLVTSNPGTMVGDELVLQPNFNVYAAAQGGNDGDRAFWTNSIDGGVTIGASGNKWMDANTFVETNSITKSSFTLQGLVASNTLNFAYQAEAFIKVLDPNAGFATVLNETIALPASGAFSVTANLSAYTGMLQQTGFRISGLNANPADEASLGSVSLTIVPEPSSSLLTCLTASCLLLRRKR
jgi:hypothetical protein